MENLVSNEEAKSYFLGLETKITSLNSKGYRIFNKLYKKFIKYDAIYANGSLGNFAPFGKEICGVKEGKIFKKKPSSMKNKEVYHHSKNGSYLLIKYNDAGLEYKHEFVIKNPIRGIDKRLMVDFFDIPKLTSYTLLIYKKGKPAISLGKGSGGELIFTYKYDHNLIKTIDMFTPAQMEKRRSFCITYDKEDRPVKIETINRPGGKETRFKFKY